MPSSFFNDTATTEIYTLSLHDALPIWPSFESFGGALHAGEHGMIGLLPLFAMCDRADIGGLSTPIHRQTTLPTIFVYDGYPGGVGISRRGYDAFESLVDRKSVV